MICTYLPTTTILLLATPTPITPALSPLLGFYDGQGTKDNQKIVTRTGFEPVAFSV